MIAGTRHMIVAGHYLATEAGHAILAAGGNAIDAGVAAGIALGVLQSEQVQFAGVAPMVVYLAGRDQALTISGLGGWPLATRPELFARDGIPMGILRTVVPAAPDAWIVALRHYGTMSFGDVASTAVRYAREGFASYPMGVHLIAKHAELYSQWPQNAAIYLPGGRPREEGELFVQKDLAATIQFMIDEERAASRRGRDAGLAAARNAFYRGDLAAAIVRFHRENGGWLSHQDLDEYRSEIEPALRARFNDIEILGCGPWCQGPVLMQMLKILEPLDIAALGHNSPAYMHVVAETMKLCFADRERYYGDPRFIDVPLDTLLSPEYATLRRRLLDPDRATPGMPPASEISSRGAMPSKAAAGDPWPRLEDELPRDTSYVGVVDAHGNAFSASPSDVSWESPIIPGLGICPSARGSQSWADPLHASAVKPRKRPRLTPSPAIAFKRGELLMPFGAPGGDNQMQAMLQVLLNHRVFKMSPQEAVEAPRFITHSFPGSFEPHPYYPGRLDVEQGIDADAVEALSAKGHDVRPLPALSLGTAGVCCVVARLDKQRLLLGAADPRRSARAMGW